MKTLVNFEFCVGMPYEEAKPLVESALGITLDEYDNYYGEVVKNSLYSLSKEYPEVKFYFTFQDQGSIHNAWREVFLGGNSTLRRMSPKFD